MNDLVCNGHNPCGDNSDCPTTVPPPREMEKNEHVMLAVIIAASATLVTFGIVSVVLYKCYQIRRKHRVSSLCMFYLCQTSELFF